MKSRNGKEPLVVCIVLNWNGMIIEHKGVPILKTCLESLAKTKYNNMKILVVDADSQDSSIDFIKKNFKNVEILRVPNKGWAFGNNRGMEYASKKYPELKHVALLNDDLDFRDRYWLKKLVDTAEKNKEIGIVTCRTIRSDGNIDYSGMHLSISGFGKQDNNTKSHYVNVLGALFLCKKELLDKIGLFDEIYLPLYGGDDTDFTERTTRAGYKVYYIGNTTVYHVGGASSSTKKIKQTFSKKEVAYCRVRGTYILLLRYYPHLIPTNFLYTCGWIFTEKKPNLKFRKASDVKMLFPMPVKGFFDALSMYKTEKIPYLKGRSA